MYPFEALSSILGAASHIYYRLHSQTTISSKMVRLAVLIGCLLLSRVVEAQQPQVRRRLQQDACPLQIGVSRCPALVASTGVMPVAGCDCYQFCGDEYVGCCNAMDEDCALIECDNINVVPTAGCRLDGIVDPVPEPACVATLSNGTMLEFEEGDSYGDILQSPCGDIEEFPCFCSSLVEDDNIRCPYCTFTTVDKSNVCARSGENITFINEFAFQQTCSCEYLGNNTVRKVCDPPNVPTQTCALKRNTDKCAQFTEFMSYDVNCPCVNFCLGKPIGCCQYGEPCSLSCPGGVTEDDIVAGCEIYPFKQPITPPPVLPPPVTPPPVASTPVTPPPVTSTPVASNPTPVAFTPVVPSLIPAPASRPCVLQKNTENCPALIQGQQQVPGCGPDACYNYCDNTFVGCCAGTAMGCSVQCPSSPNPIVITAGCKLHSP